MNSRIITKGLYLYGFIPNHSDVSKLQKLASLGVFTVQFEKVSAIVSNSSVIDFRQLSTEPLAKLLVDHQKTIENIMNMGFNMIVPMRFGTFANNVNEVVRIIENGYDLILATLSKTANFVEIDIVAMWSDFSLIIAEIAVSPKVLEMKAKIVADKKNITQSDQVSLGSLVKSIIDEKKAEYANKIFSILAPFSLSTRQHEVMNDEMVFNSAFLVNHDQAILLEQALDELDGSLNGMINFKMVGPLPCYSFFTMEIKELCFDDIDSAKEELGLENSTSEKLIKQAYLDKAKMFHPDTNSSSESADNFSRINKAYQTMLDYVNAVKPVSKDVQFSLQMETVTKNSFFLKIKE